MNLQSKARYPVWFVAALQQLKRVNHVKKLDVVEDPDGSSRVTWEQHESGVRPGHFRFRFESELLAVVKHPGMYPTVERVSRELIFCVGGTFPSLPRDLSSVVRVRPAGSDDLIFLHYVLSSSEEVTFLSLSTREAVDLLEFLARDDMAYDCLCGGELYA